MNNSETELNSTNNTSVWSAVTEGRPEPQWEEWAPLGAWVVVTGISLGLIIAFTLFGNCLVILAVVLCRRLRSVTNYFVVSLAVADLAVAILVMPFSVLYLIEGRWRFGWAFCHFWMSCDVTSCTASILHLCVISIDRYMAITEPLSYRTRMSRPRAVVLVCGVWSCSSAISFVPIFLGWFSTTTAAYDDDDEGGTCGIHPNWKYAIVSSMTSFYLPLVVMTTVYLQIFRIAKRQAAEIEFLERKFRKKNPNKINARLSRRSVRVGRDRKAIKTLGTLMGLFCFCWFPFFFMYLLGPICGSPCRPHPEVEAALTWLGYCNSFVNPCVYALMNRDFRTAFRKVLLCDCNRMTSRRQHPDVRVSTDTLSSSSSRHALLQQQAVTGRRAGREAPGGSPMHRGSATPTPVEIHLRILRSDRPARSIVVCVSSQTTDSKEL